MANAEYDILIVGAGQAARRAAEGARAVSRDLSIAIVGEEPYAPYDRPPLSKAVLESGGDVSACEIRAERSYAEERIDLLLGRRVERVDRQGRVAITADRERLGYGRLILATGSRPRALPLRPEISHRVQVLRTRTDAERLAAELKPGARVVIIGAGFIGLEVASSALTRGAKPVVLEAAPRALSRALPAVVADRLVELHRAAGVDVRLGVRVQAVEAAPGGGVRIDTDQGGVEADIVVVGIGVAPNVELAETVGLRVEDGIVVSPEGATEDPNIFAAGEVTRHPVACAGAHLRLESWQIAEIQAEAVGRTAAGQPTRHEAIPWFWTDQLGRNLQVLGCVGPGLDLVSRELPGGAAAWFALGEEGRLRGAITLDAGREIALARRLMAKGAAPPREVLEDPSRPLRQLLA